jgi:hypothetical protein
MFAGLDVGFKRTAVCVIDERGEIVWRGAHTDEFGRGFRAEPAACTG